MNCKLTLEKTLDGYTRSYITTPEGNRYLVDIVCKKEVKRKVIYKLTQEYLKDLKENGKKESK